MRFVALLRGINVGGKRKVSMPVLAKLFEAAGAANVSTFIQSGNVIFSLDEKGIMDFTRRISADMNATFGFDIPVVIRSATQLNQILSSHPHLGEEEFENRAFVMFLADTPPAAAVAALDQDPGKPDVYHLIGGEIYLWILTSAADTKLTNAFFDSKLKTICTARNWRTVVKLAELAGSDAE